MNYTFNLLEWFTYPLSDIEGIPKVIQLHEAQIFMSIPYQIGFVPSRLRVYYFPTIQLLRTTAEQGQLVSSEFVGRRFSHCLKLRISGLLYTSKHIRIRVFLRDGITVFGYSLKDGIGPRNGRSMFSHKVGVLEKEKN